MQVEPMDFNSLPKFCISLKGSPRRKLVVKEFEKAGINNVSFFDAIDKKDLVVPELSVKTEMDQNTAAGILACMSSHVELIRQAKRIGIKCMVVFEDDVIFCDDFKERIEYLQENIPVEWDMITLGGHFQKPNSPFAPHQDDALPTDKPYIYKTIQQGGTYCYIVKDSVFDFIIRNATYQYGMDEFYSTFVYKRFNCYAFVPFLVGCMHGKSEITELVWNYDNIGWFYTSDRILAQKADSHIVTVKRKMIPVNQQTQQVNLLDTTFITAVRIESLDREFNFLRVIQYLCDNFASTIIIKESAEFSRVTEILQFIDRKEMKIIHTFEKNNNAFHRTRLLNEAIVAVQTEVCVNYDIDCFMETEAYVAARNKVVNEGWDLVFPFKQGEAIQKQVNVPIHIKQNYKGESLFNPDWLTPWQSYVGHIQFFKTDSYISGGMEDENFISYGPEDRSREERFRRLGYKIMWGEFPVYHIEHSRNEDSSVKNPHFQANEDLLWRIRNMSKEELIEYCKNVPYLKKYIS